MLNLDGLRLITPPAALPVSLEEVKAHLRVDSADEDALIAKYLGAAVKALDGKAGGLFHCLAVQTWEQSFDLAFPSRIVLPLGPVSSVTSIVYVDSDGASQTLAADAYEFYPADGGDDAFVLPSWGTLWPVTRACPRAVTVRYQAGYTTLPEDLRIALLLTVGDSYKNRESTSRVDLATNRAVESFLRPYRRVKV